MVRELTPLQRAFANAYLSSPSGTQAVKDAGYDVHSDNTAANLASENLRKPKIREAILQQAKTAAEQAGLDALYVLKGLKENKERAMQERPVLDRKGEPTGEYVYDGAVANRALELMGKHLRMWGEEAATPDDVAKALISSIAALAHRAREEAAEGVGPGVSAQEGDHGAKLGDARRKVAKLVALPPGSSDTQPQET